MWCESSAFLVYLLSPTVARYSRAPAKCLWKTRFLRPNRPERDQEPEPERNLPGNLDSD